ncbi:hypothetical protein HNY73_018239 [Argiope bruennichi]|uniref:Uncharacterized protein n=1 Tax=Argiope bruennichi TaxID=94029 RepID=A0A8T0ECK2_ARGBR|nr:hypothetical protein HNY73_018239 [Argiope bruennichi]
MNFVIEIDAKSTFSKHSNKNDEAAFQNKDDTKKLTFENDTEDIEKLFSSLSLKNNELLNNNYESDSDTSTGYESNSDSDEQGQSAVLRERYPQRHNRPENNKQLRITPFPQNHAKFCNQHFRSENSQTSVNISPMFDNFNVFHNGCNLLNNISNTNGEEYDASSSIRTFHSCFPSSESVTGEVFENIFLSRVENQIVNNVIPCRATNKIIDDIIPYKNTTNQVINGIIPCAVMDEIFDSVVPSPNDIGNDIFSAEINDIPNYNNLEETFFSESNDTSYNASDGERKTVLDSHFENLPSEEVDQMLKEFILKLKSDHFSNQSCENLSENFQLHELSSNELENFFDNSSKSNQNNVFAFKESNFSKHNQQNFDTKIRHTDSFLSKENLKETSMHSYLAKRNNVLGKLSKFHDSKSGNYSNLISENISSINRESLSHKTSDFVKVSEEIEHKIVKYKEMDRIIKGQKPLPLHSDSVTELSWDMFPFVEIDDNSISECLNSPKFAV